MEEDGKPHETRKVLGIMMRFVTSVISIFGEFLFVYLLKNVL